VKAAPFRQRARLERNSANKHGVGKFGLRSIDAPAYADGTTNYGDAVSEGLWE
jgi:hypothetical protein